MSHSQIQLCSKANSLLSHEQLKYYQQKAHLERSEMAHRILKKLKQLF